jgi:hypothetical protein
MDATIQILKESVETNLQTCGFLVPIALVYTAEAVKSLCIADCPKGKELEIMCEVITKEHAHKLILITEAWRWLAPEHLSEEEVKNIINHDAYTHQFEQEMVYQIIEVTRDNIYVLSKPVYKEVQDINGNGEVSITFGEEISSELTIIDGYADIQKALSAIN